MREGFGLSHMHVIFAFFLPLRHWTVNEKLQIFVFRCSSGVVVHPRGCYFSSTFNLCCETDCTEERWEKIPHYILKLNLLSGQMCNPVFLFFSGNKTQANENVSLKIIFTKHFNSIDQKWCSGWCSNRSRKEKRGCKIHFCFDFIIINSKNDLSLCAKSFLTTKNRPHKLLVVGTVCCILCFIILPIYDCCRYFNTHIFMLQVTESCTEAMHIFIQALTSNSQLLLFEFVLQHYKTNFTTWDCARDRFQTEGKWTGAVKLSQKKW